jgi:hypothetical protein
MKPRHSYIYRVTVWDTGGTLQFSDYFPTEAAAKALCGDFQLTHTRAFIDRIRFFADLTGASAVCQAALLAKRACRHGAGDGAGGTILQTDQPPTCDCCGARGVELGALTENTVVMSCPDCTLCWVLEDDGEYDTDHPITEE